MSAVAIYPVPIKKAVKLIKDWEANSKSCLPNPETSNAIEYLISRDRCTSCGKKMVHIKDEDGKIDKYSWWCSCFPKNVRMSKG